MKYTSILILALILNTVAALEPKTVEDCDAIDQYLYNHQCLTDSCYQKMDRLTKVGEYLDPVGTIDPSIYAKVELENGNMLVHIYQDDEKDDPLESDDCINVEIWQTETDNDQNPTVIEYTPHWPQFYENKYVITTSDTLRSFTITPDDLTKCLFKENEDGNKEYYCYFLLKFTLKGITQAEYFFQTKIIVNSGVTNEISDFDFESFRQVDKSPLACYDENGSTECVENVNTSLKFCTDETCSKFQDPKAIIVNELFFVAHIIEDDAFKNWTLELRDNGVFYTGLGLKVPGKIEEVVPSGNMLIYYLKASAAYEDVTVTITSYLVDPNGNRRLLQASNDTPFSTGKSAKFSTTDDSDDEDKKDDKDKVDQGNNGYILGVIGIIMMALGL